MDLTIDLSKLRVQSKTDFRRVHAHQLVLVILDISKPPDNLLQNVIRVWTHVVNLRRYQLVDREDIRHLDEQGRLRLGVEVVEFINIKVRFRILDRYHCHQLASFK